AVRGVFRGDDIVVQVVEPSSLLLGRPIRVRAVQPRLLRQFPYATLESRVQVAVLVPADERLARHLEAGLAPVAAAARVADDVDPQPRAGEIAGDFAEPVEGALHPRQLIVRDAALLGLDGHAQAVASVRVLHDWLFLRSMMGLLSPAIENCKPYA